MSGSWPARAQERELLELLIEATVAATPATLTRAKRLAATREPSRLLTFELPRLEERFGTLSGAIDAHRRLARASSAIPGPLLPLADLLILGGYEGEATRLLDDYLKRVPEDAGPSMTRLMLAGLPLGQVVGGLHALGAAHHLLGGRTPPRSA